MFWYTFFLVALLIPLVSILLDSPVGKALAARIERKDLPGSGAGEERLSLLEMEVERLGKEVDRLGEESEFLQRLLTDRPSGSTPPPSLPGKTDSARGDGES